jgi:hypothetical protein
VRSQVSCPSRITFNQSISVELMLSAVTCARYRLDPVFEHTPDGAVIGIIRYHIYLDGRFVGSRSSTHSVTISSMN